MKRSFSLAVAAVFTSALVACTGGGSSSTSTPNVPNNNPVTTPTTAPTTTPSGGSGAQSTNVLISFSDLSTSTGTATSAKSRVPQAITTNAKSLVVAVDNLPALTQTFNIVNGSNGCTSAANTGITGCSFSLANVPFGIHDFTATVYDNTNGTGTVIGSGTAPHQCIEASATCIAAGNYNSGTQAYTVAFTLNANVFSLTLSASATVSGASSTLVEGSPSNFKVLVSPKSSDGSTVIFSATGNLIPTMQVAIKDNGSNLGDVTNTHFTLSASVPGSASAGNVLTLGPSSFSAVLVGPNSGATGYQIPVYYDGTNADGVAGHGTGIVNATIRVTAGSATSTLDMNSIPAPAFSLQGGGPTTCETARLPQSNRVPLVTCNAQLQVSVSPFFSGGPACVLNSAPYHYRASYGYNNLQPYRLASDFSIGGSAANGAGVTPPQIYDVATSLLGTNGSPPANAFYTSVGGQALPISYRISGYPFEPGAHPGFMTVDWDSQISDHDDVLVAMLGETQTAVGAKVQTNSVDGNASTINGLCSGSGSVSGS